MTPPSDDIPTFEAAYQELSEIIDQLEAGDASLDDTLKLYERGRALITVCQGLLDSAELRVSQLNADSESNDA
jgi:exodeoxyribonuclease VII small subunit